MKCFALNLFLSGRHWASRWQRREGVCILISNKPHCSLSVVFVFVNGSDTEIENICVSGGCFERGLSWGLLCREQRNIWIHTMLMSCGTIEWENVTGWKPCVLMFWLWDEARCLKLHCHSQGDTVLVGGPAGEKGNKGETVSEHLTGSKF